MKSWVSKHAPRQQRWRCRGCRSWRGFELLADVGQVCSAIGATLHTMQSLDTTHRTARCSEADAVLHELQDKLDAARARKPALKRWALGPARPARPRPTCNACLTMRRSANWRVKSRAKTAAILTPPSRRWPRFAPASTPCRHHPSPAAKPAQALSCANRSSRSAVLATWPWSSLSAAPKWWWPRCATSLNRTVSKRLK